MWGFKRGFKVARREGETTLRRGRLSTKAAAALSGVTALVKVVVAFDSVYDYKKVMPMVGEENAQGWWGWIREFRVGVPGLGGTNSRFAGTIET